MKKVVFVVPRDSMDEMTVAVVSASITRKGAQLGIADIDRFLKMLMGAVTRWAAETEEGRDAWVRSSRDFNIGDLSSEDLAPIIARMDGAVKDLKIETYVDLANNRRSWVYDTVLVDESLIDEKARLAWNSP